MNAYILQGCKSTFLWGGSRSLRISFRPSGLSGSGAKLSRSGYNPQVMPYRTSTRATLWGVRKQSEAASSPLPCTVVCSNKAAAAAISSMWLNRRWVDDTTSV